MFASFLIALCIGLFYVESGFFIEEANAGKTDGVVNPLVYLYDLSLLLLFMLAIYKHEFGPGIKKLGCVFVAAYIGFVLGVSAEPLPFLRMYFYVEWFRAFFIVIILSRIVRLDSFVVFAAILVLLGGLYTNYRISSSDLGFHFSILSFGAKPISFWLYFI